MNNCGVENVWKGQNIWEEMFEIDFNTSQYLMYTQNVFSQIRFLSNFYYKFVNYPSRNSTPKKTVAPNFLSNFQLHTLKEDVMKFHGKYGKDS